MMQWTELKEWRKKFAKVEGTLAAKQVARDFRDALQISDLRGYQIYTALRSNKLEEVMEIVSQESVAEIQRKQTEACSPETLRRENIEPQIMPLEALSLFCYFRVSPFSVVSGGQAGSK